MLALLLASSLRVVPAAGVGVAYGMGGVHLELGYGHFGAFGGVGFTDFPDPAMFDAVAAAAPVAGLRLYSGDGDGFFLSAQAGYFSTRKNVGSGSEFFAAQRYALAADLGYRLPLGRFAT